MIRGLISDDEWAVFERFLARSSKQGGRPPKNHRRVLDGVFWIARTGAPTRQPAPTDIPRMASQPDRLRGRLHAVRRPLQQRKCRDGARGQRHRPVLAVRGMSIKVFL